MLRLFLSIFWVFGAFWAAPAPARADGEAVPAAIPYRPVLETPAPASAAPSLAYQDLAHSDLGAAPTLRRISRLSTGHAVSSAISSAMRRASQPVPRGASALASLRQVDLFKGGKLLLTNGISSLEGTSGGGLATWATIAGMETARGIGASGHFTAVELPDFGWRSYGVALGIADRVELSYARQNFDTRDAGAALGLGRGYTFNQDVLGAKVRLAGDTVYGAALMPQIAAGIEYKRNLDGAVVGLLGARDDEGIDYTLSATKLLLEHSLLINATARLTKANQLGLLGFGGPDNGYQLQFEGSLGYQLSRRAVLGAEYRSKPDNLGLGEDEWIDLFAAYAITDNITLTAAYVDLGTIATFEEQRGALVQAQFAF